MKVCVKPCIAVVEVEVINISVLEMLWRTDLVSIDIMHQTE